VAAIMSVNRGLSRAITTKLTKGTKESPTNRQGSVTLADLAGPASPGRDQLDAATDKTSHALETGLVGSRRPTDRIAAGGGRQVSACLRSIPPVGLSFVFFVSFVVRVLALGTQIGPA